MTSSKTRASSSSYHAVEIQRTERACEASRGTIGKRFLSTEAPPLPLSQCDRPNACRCSYRHFSDRRVCLRRPAELAPLRATFGDRLDKRGLPSRRVNDYVPTGIDPSPWFGDSYYDFVKNAKAR